jgi:putative hemolysin
MSTLLLTETKAVHKNWFENISVNITDKDLEKIPEKGALFTISNRPIGFIEELIIARCVGQKRNDFCFLNNSNLSSVESFYKSYLNKNHFLKLEKLIEENKLISLFPVGNTSSFQGKGSSLSDSIWDKSIIRKIYQNNLKIVPIYITIENEAFLKMQALMVNEDYSYEIVTSMIEHTGVEVTVRIGKPIVKSKFEFQSINQFSRFLRAKLYSLGSKIKVDYFYNVKEKVEKIVEPIDPISLEAELLSITDTNKIGEQGNFDIYLAKAKKIPLAIKEIGRLREITFRNIGEGTNNQIDLDEYDLHYLHLFVYDREAKKIAGAYRIGDGKYIMETIGKKGFYIQSLFKISNKFSNYLSASIELGRSFVVDEYQNHRLPLYLLWQGINYYISNSDYLKYIIGPVSISSSYSKISRSFIVAHIMKHHWDYELAKMIQPKTAFKTDFENIDYEILLEKTGNSIKLLDDIIDDIDPEHSKVPILLKKYFSKQAKIIGFNLDPKFNDALDGFMITKIDQIELDILNFSKNVNKEDYAN